jgi:teichuronic acid biosynthesis glycosyltransferase TuaH
MRSAAAQGCQGQGVLFLSHGHWESTFVVGSQHLARELARAGWDVVRVVTPLTPFHAALKRSDPGNTIRRWARGDERHVDDSGVVHVRPSIPLPVHISGAGYGPRVLGEVGMARPRFVFVDQPLMLAKWVFDLGSTVIYRPTDIYADRHYRRLEQAWVPRVDGVIATSGPVLEALDIPPGKPTMVLRNGVDLGSFGGIEVPWSERRGVVYIGALDDRFDWDSLCNIAEALPDIPFTIGGPNTRNRTAPSNVSLIGPVRYEDVPSVLSRHRVALMPFSSTLENLGRSPMKLYECVASGLSVVVSSHLGEIPEDIGEVCRVYGNADEAVRRVVEAHDNDRSQGMARLDAIRRHSWQAIAQAALAFATKVETMRLAEEAERPAIGFGA